MEEANMFNFALGIIGTMFTINLALIGVIWTTFTNRLNKVESENNELKLLVSGKYILREEALANDEKRQIADAKIMDKLDEIKKEIVICMSHHNRRRGDVDPE